MSTQPYPSPPSTGALRARRVAPYTAPCVPLARAEAARDYVRHFKSLVRITPHLMRDGATDAYLAAVGHLRERETCARLERVAAACWVLWSPWRALSVRERRGRVMEVREALVRCGVSEVEAHREACAVSEVVG